MAPVIQKFLVEGCSLVAYAGRTMDSLINYLDKNLILLKDKLNSTNFDRVLSVIWQCSAHSLHDTISLSIERRKPPSYFKTLLDILRILIQFFYADKAPNDETLLKMEAQLQLYASDSHILISRYFKFVAIFGIYIWKDLLHSSDFERLLIWNEIGLNSS